MMDYMSAATKNTLVYISMSVRWSNQNNYVIFLFILFLKKKKPVQHFMRYSAPSLFEYGRGSTGITFGYYAVDVSPMRTFI